MGKVKQWYRSIPIWLAMCLFIGIALLLASFVSGKLTDKLNELSLGIQVKYITVTHDLTHSDSDVLYSGDDFDEIVHYDFNFQNYTEEDQQLYRFYNFLQHFVSPFFYTVSILIAVLLFYFTKLKTPLRMLTQASDRIAENELDFTLEYAGYDEMARLCSAFEKMRCSLDENNKRMLRMIDERKQLNDAYTHDLRTPIAVLKGYADMLSKFVPSGKMQQEEILEIVRTMSAHISRLEQFAESMNTVQKLEDLSLQKNEVQAQEFLEHIRESAMILCQSSNLQCDFKSDITYPTLMLDAGMVLQVYENLMSNAVRFAKAKITVRCSHYGNTFFLAVSDDGKGFSEKDLLKAARPYYSGEGQKQEYHFGLGLHICKTLCEKHGGRLELDNNPQGGAKITASFST